MTQTDDLIARLEEAAENLCKSWNLSMAIVDIIL